MKNALIIPVLAFAGYSDSGKTTLAEQVIKELTARGYRVAAIKHDGHDILSAGEQEKDSVRFLTAGAVMSIAASASRTIVTEEREYTLMELLPLVQHADIILVEGFKNEPLTQIGVRCTAADIELPASLERYIAVVSDCELPGTGIPCFSRDDIAGIADFILANLSGFTQFDRQNSILLPQA